MSEMADRQEMIEQHQPSGSGVPAAGLMVLVIITCAALFGRSLLTGELWLGEIETLENWSYFGQRVLREILLAVAVINLAVLVSAYLPQVGLIAERLVLYSGRRSFLVVTVLLAFASSAALSWFVLGGLPHIQDEGVMVFQAKVLAQGRLFAQTPPLPDFFDYEYIIADGPRWYGKYFAGPSLAMVPGVWIGAIWLMSPLFGAATVLLTYLLGRELLGEKIARVATLLMVFSPFRTSLFAMMMAHPVTMLVLTLAGLAVVKVVRDPRSWLWAALAGAALGFAVNSRPVTAAVLGGIMGSGAILAICWRQLRWQTVMAFAVPMLLMAGVYLGYNQALTGQAGLTPFEKWCPKDRLGFGPDIGNEYWPEKDRGHSLRKALLHNSYFNLDTLGANLTGFGYPALLLLFAGPLLCNRRKVGWLLAAATGGLMAAYLCYFTPSAFAGQARYWSEAMPAMLLLVAVSLGSVRRLLPRLCRSLGVLPAVRTGRAACWLTGAALLAYGLPMAYGNLLDEFGLALWTRATTLRNLADEIKLENAVVFVPSKHYRDSRIDARWDCYNDAFALNDPDLQNSVVYARELSPEQNLELLKLYPGRRVYRVDLYAEQNFSFVPLDPERDFATPGPCETQESPD